MFDIGFLEMMTIGIVALVVIGPERLPAVAAKVGRYVGKAQRFVRGVRSDISRELETGDLKKLIGDQKDQIDELRTMVHSATKDIKSSTGDAFKDAEKSINELKETAVDPSLTSRVDNDPELLNDAGVSNETPVETLNEKPANPVNNGGGNGSDAPTQANDKAS